MADATTLDFLEGVDDLKSKAIIDERVKNGPFKNFADLANRVNGLDPKSVAKWEEQGLLTFDGGNGGNGGNGSGDE
jgi:competence protein ComEA